MHLADIARRETDRWNSCENAGRGSAPRAESSRCGKTTSKAEVTFENPCGHDLSFGRARKQTSAMVGQLIASYVLYIARGPSKNVTADPMA